MATIHPDKRYDPQVRIDDDSNWPENKPKPTVEFIRNGKKVKFFMPPFVRMIDPEVDKPQKFDQYWCEKHKRWYTKAKFSDPFAEGKLYRRMECTQKEFSVVEHNHDLYLDDMPEELTKGAPEGLYNDDRKVTFPMCRKCRLGGIQISEHPTCPETPEHEELHFEPDPEHKGYFIVTKKPPEQPEPASQPAQVDDEAQPEAEAEDETEEQEVLDPGELTTLLLELQQSNMNLSNSVASLGRKVDERIAKLLGDIQGQKDLVAARNEELATVTTALHAAKQVSEAKQQINNDLLNLLSKHHEGCRDFNELLDSFIEDTVSLGFSMDQAENLKTSWDTYLDSVNFHEREEQETPAEQPELPLTE